MKPTLNYLTDPDLRTSTGNHNFKYVRVSDLEKVVDTVRRDRLKWQQDDLWTNFCQAEQFICSGDDEISVQKPSMALKSCLKPPRPEHKSTIRILSDQEIDDIVNAAIEAKLQQLEVTKRFKISNCHALDWSWRGSKVSSGITGSFDRCSSGFVRVDSRQQRRSSRLSSFDHILWRKNKRFNKKKKSYVKHFALK